jgi:3-hydroxyacyl-CoA dehydrogenase
VCFGFIGNRILWARGEQAAQLLKEGVSPYAIDAALVEFGFPMGHFQMLDLAGLDIGEPDPVRAALIAAGRKGQKSGAGFYDYAADRKGAPDPRALDLIGGVVGVAPGTKVLPADELLARLLYPMINEGAKILAEGIALRASDIDVVYVMGYGWPPHTGGPMFHADRVGLPAIVRALEAMPGVSVAPLLARLAAEGGALEG